ncbi:MAG: TolC family protein [Lewinellaceae bacterium]|nr:TolC family protein [Lewinellaceae bacterium]
MNRIITRTAFFLLCLLPGLAFGQDIWSLERCINYAQDNNITIKQAQAAVRTAQLTESQAKAARLPNVNAGANAGEQFGRTIDLPPTSSTILVLGTTA